MKIDRIDRNFKIDATINEPDVVLHDVREDPFDVYGLYDYRNEPQFCRMPDSVAKTVSDGVRQLARNTAGGRVRFRTDSKYVAIRAEMPGIMRFPHMPLSGTSGFDLYIDRAEDHFSRHFGTFVPPMTATEGYEGKIVFPDRRMRYITINFPSYNSVTNLCIGLQKDAKVDHGLRYIDALPMVFYGSSITQGGCSSRPGTAFVTIIGRRMDRDFLNLGFSGSAKAEPEMVEYLSNLPMSVFISDYDHNAPNADYLRSTHEKLYRGIRAKHPDVPYVMIGKPDFYNDVEDHLLRRDVIFDTYRKAREDGDRNVYFVDGESLFRGRFADGCTVEGCHPNDLGFSLMAEAIESEIRVALYGDRR